MNQATILNESSSAIHSLFSHTKVSPNRLVYITVGLMFEPASPKPFGGPKIRPGYAEYNGKTVASLVQYIVSASFKWYWACRGRDAIDFLTHNVNKARKLHYDGNADTLNELMLKGMKKAGHIEWNKPARIPDALQHRPEVDPDLDRYSVEFTPRMKGSGLQQNQLLSMVGEVGNHADTYPTSFIHYDSITCITSELLVLFIPAFSDCPEVQFLGRNAFMEVKLRPAEGGEDYFERTIEATNGRSKATI
ncbi:hypothetical protein BJ741DRAFT_260367 [Chytriomyces cf. hyalinus JEL632]|nr:hypothetical protein BJ741DRAFT_260367 [Chytriomyces cf. hyalinus JEL632]